MIKGDDSEAYQGYSFANWAANQWHHIAVTWTVPGRMITYVDGVERINHPSNSQDTISPLPANLNLGSRSVTDADQADCVIDGPRISGVARTQPEIQARLFAALTVNSVSVGLVTRNLWKTWRVTPEAVANTNLGKFCLPAGAVTWSSSNPGVAAVNAAGQIVGVGAGPAVRTATFNGVPSSVSVNVRAPALEARVEAPGNYLATPAAGALYETPVVILRYLPTADGVNLDGARAPDFYSLTPPPPVAA
jgi:Concanavalin A-like lectin/glucanases superfamily